VGGQTRSAYVPEPKEGEGLLGHSVRQFSKFRGTILLMWTYSHLRAHQVDLPWPYLQDLRLFLWALILADQ